MTADLAYKPDGDELRRFMLCDDFFRGLRGPVGSGKSVGCCIEVFRRALAQKPSPRDGVRRSRWAIVRNTNPQLRTTTIKTWLDWFPEERWGKMLWHPPPFVHHVKQGDLDLEVIFLALDRPEDVKKLLSLELTGVFINEAREVPKAIVDACTMRVGRYPSMKDGGPSWYGVIADTNAPDDIHWWPIMAGEAPLPEHISREEALMLVKPSNWSFFTQPAGMIEKFNDEGEVSEYLPNPDAENLNNLDENYYPNIIRGKTKSWIDVYVMNRLGTISEGKPVYPDFSRATHVAKEPLQAAIGLPVIVGLDFGLTPAAVFCQFVRGRWLVLHELVATDMGAVKFAKLLKRECAQMFPGHSFVFWGDPSGDFRAQTDETTPFQILRTEGITARAAPTNDPVVRIEAVAGCLTRLNEGLPGLLVDPSCVTIIRGFEGGYCRARLNVAGAERYSDQVDKSNPYSHPHDALQYAVCGGGESRRVLMGDRSGQQPVNARQSIDVFGHARRTRSIANRRAGL